MRAKLTGSARGAVAQLAGAACMLRSRAVPSSRPVHAHSENIPTDGVAALLRRGRQRNRRPVRTPPSGRVSAWCFPAAARAAPRTSVCSRRSIVCTCRSMRSPAPAWAPWSAASTPAACPAGRSSRPWPRSIGSPHFAIGCGARSSAVAARKRTEIFWSICRSDCTAASSSFPRGSVQGEKLTETLRQLTLPVGPITDFDRLPTPFRAVATNLETGEAVVIEDGDLTTAMRASMSAPGCVRAGRISRASCWSMAVWPKICRSMSRAPWASTC